jgi:GDPmannose 4,6-dehydratase
MTKRALICGISGQDGSYLAKLLLEKGFEVWGGSRDAEAAEFKNLKQLRVFNSVRLLSLNLRDIGTIIGLLRKVQPSEVFSLAGQSSVALSFDQPVETFESISLGTVNLLEAIRLTDPSIRFYNASSTECFGDTGHLAANEATQFHPRSPYAVAKASAYWTVVNYREAYGMFACNGILSNHDSPLRPMRFVTRKIIHAVASLAIGKESRLSLGNLDIERDWGWAPEYVEAISLMLEHPYAQDFIIATGHSHTLTEFVDVAFDLIGKQWREFVTSTESLRRPTDIQKSKVDPSKAKNQLGWRAKVHMEQVISFMLEAEMKNLHDHEGGPK